MAQLNNQSSISVPKSLSLSLICLISVKSISGFFCRFPVELMQSNCLGSFYFTFSNGQLLYTKQNNFLPSTQSFQKLHSFSSHQARRRSEFSKSDNLTVIGKHRGIRNSPLIPPISSTKSHRHAMSSWKKATKTNQRTHRERHQPDARKHLGLLEKKKDYRLRARDVHNKEKTLKALRKKALDRNPDEFYHHMIRSKVQDDEHHEFEQGDEHTAEQIALMQTQDIKYVMMKRTIEARKIQRLQGELHMIGAADETPNKHIFFVDNDAEMENFDLAQRLETHPSLVARKSNRPRVGDLAKLNVPDVDEQELRRLETKRENAYKELQKRIDREKELALIQRKLEMKRILRQKRALKPKKIQKGTKESAPVYSFKYERKK